MTLKDFLNTLHCASRDNIGYHIYEYETDKRWNFETYDELLKYLKITDILMEREIEYFSFNQYGFKFTADIRLKVAE